jgi:hypothetical protein
MTSIRPDNIPSDNDELIDIIAHYANMPLLEGTTALGNFVNYVVVDLYYDWSESEHIYRTEQLYRALLYIDIITVLDCVRIAPTINQSLDNKGGIDIRFTLVELECIIYWGAEWLLKTIV